MVVKKLCESNINNSDDNNNNNGISDGIEKAPVETRTRTLTLVTG